MNFSLVLLLITENHDLKKIKFTSSSKTQCREERLVFFEFVGPKDVRKTSHESYTIGKNILLVFKNSFLLILTF